jgi:CDP-paratose 2-epimerase
VEADAHERAYDIPWVVMDSSASERHFGWQVDTPISTVLDEIAVHAENNPDWLERSGM